MSDRIDLEDRAKTMIWELAHDWSAVGDIDEDQVHERVHEEADNAVIYYHWADQVINDYENRPEVPNESELGGEYRADQWREAATAWAYEVARAVLHPEAEICLQEIREEAEEFADWLAKEFDQDMTADDLTLSQTCLHGWASHDREEADGAMIWESRQLDGLNAVALEVCGLWLSWTWDPAAATDAEDDQ